MQQLEKIPLVISALHRFYFNYGANFFQELFPPVRKVYFITKPPTLEETQSILILFWFIASMVILRWALMKLQLPTSFFILKFFANNSIPSNYKTHWIKSAMQKWHKSLLTNFFAILINFFFCSQKIVFCDLCLFICILTCN